VLKVLSVALPVLATTCIGGGALLSAPMLSNGLYIAGLALSSLAIVLHFVGMRSYDPYKGRRHSAD
jgi:hypothetical protein